MATSTPYPVGASAGRSGRVSGAEFRGGRREITAVDDLARTARGVRCCRVCDLEKPLELFPENGTGRLFVCTDCAVRRWSGTLHPEPNRLPACAGCGHDGLGVHEYADPLRDGRTLAYCDACDALYGSALSALAAGV